jgi:hypothetical protein
MHYAILLHSDSPDKKDHHDIVLEIVEGNSLEEPHLDKLETFQIDLEGTRIMVEPQDLIRRKYLTYEGPMSNNRGIVKRVDEGLYRILDDDSLEFDGNILHGRYRFEGEEVLQLVKVS